MRYFDGITFMYCGDRPHHTTNEENRYFPGYYGIQYNHSGSLCFARGDDPTVQVEGPHVFITHPDMKFRYSAPPGKSRHHIFVSFKGPRVEKFIRNGLMAINPGQPLIRITDPERFHRTFLELIRLISSNQPQNYSRSVLMLEDLLLQLQEQSPEKSEVGSHLVPGLRKLEVAMEQDPHLDWDFTKEAKHLGISYPHFRRIFRQYTGTSPLNYLIRCRLRKASWLLLSSDEPISSVAEKSGMPDMFYFSRMFKKYYNIPPLSYRKEFKSK